MAVVKKEEIRFPNGETGFLETKYSSRKEYFYVDLPPYMKKAFPKVDIVKGDTVKLVRLHWDEICETYRTLSTVRKKMIIYSIIGDKVGKPETGSWGGVSKSTMLALKWSIVYRLKLYHNETIYINAKTKTERDHYDKDYEKIIEWTPEREAFFNELQKKLEQLVSMAKGFFKQRKERQLLFMDQNRKLLPGGSDE